MVSLEAKQRFPLMKPTELSRELAAMWKRADKAPYVKRYAELMEEYSAKVKAFEAMKRKPSS